MTVMKTCTDCKEEKPTSAFHRNTASRDGFHTKCSPCRNAFRRARYAADPEPFRESQKWRNTKSRRGIDKDGFALLEVKQSGLCAICGQPQKDRRGTRLCIDHDHVTGETRALLCTPCNLLLGYAEDDVDRLIAAASYLLSFRNVLETS